MEKTIFMDGIRNFFIVVDKGIYSLIGILYNIIVTLAEIKIVEDTSIDMIANRLYSFIGIFMLFKVSFSLINYIINPDSVTDKEKGGAKMITNIVITFVLIIITPFCFNLLTKAQSAILNDNIIPTLFSGSDTSFAGEFKIDDHCTDSVQAGLVYDFNEQKETFNYGEYVAMMSLRPFYQINDSISADDITTFIDETNYCSATDVTKLLTPTIVNEAPDEEEPYYVDYSLLLSTVIGIILVLIFAGFCLDIALRTVKLAFLEIIAPIPIMSYIDPASSKKGMFSKWLKEVGTTWADLFIRLIAVFFALFLISNIQWSNTGNNVIIDVLIILGILMFAKKLPDILKKMLNIDVKGDFKLNPLKKIKDDVPVLGKPMAGLATGTAAAAIGGLTSFRGNSVKERFANAGKGFTTGMKGGYKDSATLKGLGSGMVPYRELRKKEKEEIKKANVQLKEFDNFEKEGKKLIMNSRVKDRNGNFEYERDDNGNVKVDSNGYAKIKITPESKARNFASSEYRNSFLNVESKKSDLKEAKRKYDAAVDYQNALRFNPNATEEQRNAALKNVTDTREKVEKLEGVLSGAKERHKIVQQKYTEDTKRENAMKEYMDRNPDSDELKVRVVAADTPESDQTSESSQSASTNNAQQNNNSSTQESKNEQHQEFKSYDEIVKQKNEEYAKSDNPWEKLVLEQEISDLKGETEESQLQAKKEEYEKTREAYEKSESSIEKNLLAHRMTVLYKEISDLEKEERKQSTNENKASKQEVITAKNQMEQTAAKIEQVDEKRRNASSDEEFISLGEELKELHEELNNASEVYEATIEDNENIEAEVKQEQYKKKQAERVEIDKEIDELTKQLNILTEKYGDSAYEMKEYKEITNKINEAILRRAK